MPAKLSHCRPFQPQLDCQLQAIVGHPEAWEVRLPPCAALPPIGPNQDNMCSPRMPCTASNLLLLASALCANGKLCRGHLDSAGCPRRTRRACNLCQQCFFHRNIQDFFWTKTERACNLCQQCFFSQRNIQDSFLDKTAFNWLGEHMIKSSSICL